MASDTDYQPSSNQETQGEQESAALRFGRYEVVRRADGSLWELGRGGMGITYKALDPKLRRLVVLKVINPIFLGNDPQARARFQREARSAANVHHTHIATIFDIGEEGNNDFYVMEFIEGADLLTRLKRDGPLDVTAALRVARQVAEALEAAWQQGIVHRDIKPANLMVVRHSTAREAREGPLVKIVDFGLAKALKVAGAASNFSPFSAMMTSAAQPMFTPAYASPEQIEDEELDIRSDLYSLGVSLWQMLTGTPTFGDASKQKIIVGHLSKEPPFDDLRAAHVPENVIEFLGELLEKSPADRPATPEATLEVIARLLEHTAYKPSASSGPEPPPVFDSFPLIEVLRCRGALTVNEALKLLDAIAPQIDVMMRKDAAAIPELNLARILVRFNTPPVNLQELPGRPLNDWPAFTLRLGGDADSTQSRADQTVPPGDGGFQAGNAVQAAGAFVYELLDGKPPEPRRYRPIAINEAANAVLSRSLEAKSGFRTVTEFAQAARTAMESAPPPNRQKAPPEKKVPVPPERKEVRQTGSEMKPTVTPRSILVGLTIGLALLLTFWPKFHDSNNKDPNKPTPTSTPAIVGPVRFDPSLPPPARPTDTPTPISPAPAIAAQGRLDDPYAVGVHASESKVPILRNLPPRTIRGLDGKPLTGDMGIGVAVEIPFLKAQIGKVLRDSPAYRAGIRSGMRLAKINQRSVPGWTLNANDCANLIRESESPVTLGIDPGDGKVYDVIIYKEPLSAANP